MHEDITATKRASYIRAQNFAAPSIKSTTNQLQFPNNVKSCRTNNIMFDSRVCRGNTYSNPVVTEDQLRNRRIYEREQVSRRRSMQRRREYFRDGTPPPVKGRLHVSTQTEATMDDILRQKEQIMMSTRTSSLFMNEFDKMQEEEPNSIHSTQNTECKSKKILPSCSDDKSSQFDKHLKRLTEMILEEATRNAISRLEENRRYCSDTEYCA